MTKQAKIDHLKCIYNNLYHVELEIALNSWDIEEVKEIRLAKEHIQKAITLYSRKNITPL